MDFKYNFSFKNRYKILFVYTYIFPINSIKKEFKLMFQQYLIKDISFNEFEKQRNIYKNNILCEKDNILIIKSNNKINDINCIDHLWFYSNPNDIYKEIIESFNNKLKILNGKLYNYLISDFKFKDIFTLLYNNESI